MLKLPGLTEGGKRTVISRTLGQDGQTGQRSSLVVWPSPLMTLEKLKELGMAERGTHKTGFVIESLKSCILSGQTFGLLLFFFAQAEKDFWTVARSRPLKLNLSVQVGKLMPEKGSNLYIVTQ